MKSAKANKEQAQTIYRLCGYNKEQKEEAVFGITEDPQRKSCYDLSYAEANELITALGGKVYKTSNWYTFDSKKKTHRYILSLCHQLGWVKTGMKVVDLERLGNWLKSERSPVQKPLMKMTSAEVNVVINALESMTKKEFAK